MEHKKWFEIDDVKGLVTPALVVYPKRIEENIQLMIRIAGGADSLRPHIKTYKIAEVIEMQLKHGITKFKCATVAEADLLARCNIPDVLLAVQPVGVHIDRFFELIAKYPNTKFSTIVDCESVIEEISTTAGAKHIVVNVWLDINNGMDRTGVLPNHDALALYQKIEADPNLIANGLHVYDGHIHEHDFDLRKEICDRDFASVLKLKQEIEVSGIKIETIVAGGTPTFPIHAKRENTEVSPGTPLLWDQGYAEAYKDLSFLPAAVLIGNVISKPNANLICLNLGHKSVAAEMGFPRLHLLNFDECTQISHSEEHLVIECKDPVQYSVGAICYTIPTHICPTVIKYSKVLTSSNHKITGSWEVAARDYLLTEERPLG